MFTNSISDQLTDSFEELMLEIRAMRKELQAIRVALEHHQHGHSGNGTRPVRGARTTTAGSRRKVA